MRSICYSLPEFVEPYAPDRGLRVAIAPKVGRALVLRAKEVSEGQPWEEAASGAKRNLLNWEVYIRGGPR